MQWIKASERFPEAPLTALFRNIANKNVGYNIREIVSRKDSFEWLDESAPASQPSAPTEAASGLTPQELELIAEQKALDSRDGYCTKDDHAHDCPCFSYAEGFIEGYNFKPEPVGELKTIAKSEALKYAQQLSWTIESPECVDMSLTLKCDKYSPFLHGFIAGASHTSTPPTATPEAAKDMKPDTISRLVAIHETIREILEPEPRNWEAVKGYLLALRDTNNEVNVLKTVMVITNGFKDNPVIADARKQVVDKFNLGMLKLNHKS